MEMGMLLGKPILMVSGMTREGHIAKGHDSWVVSVLSGGSLQTLRQRLDQINPTSIRAVVSFGVAGALSPDIPAGSLVLPDKLMDDTGLIYPLAPIPTAKICGKTVRGGTFLGTATPRYTAADKISAWSETGCMACDLESVAAAEYAARWGLPFNVIRTISDGQTFSLPPLANTAMNPDGSMNLGAIWNSLRSDPGQIPDLLRLWWYSEKAFWNLQQTKNRMNWPAIGKTVSNQ